MFNTSYELQHELAATHNGVIRTRPSYIQASECKQKNILAPRQAPNRSSPWHMQVHGVSKYTSLHQRRSDYSNFWYTSYSDYRSSKDGFKTCTDSNSENYSFLLYIPLTEKKKFFFIRTVLLWDFCDYINKNFTQKLTSYHSILDSVNNISIGGLEYTHWGMIHY